MRVVSNVVFSEGAIYDRTGQTIMDAAYCRGVPERHIVSGWGERQQSSFSSIDLASIQDDPFGEPCVWIGPLFPHYGHFLLSAVSRLWALQQPECSGRRLLHAGSMNVPALFHGQHYVASIFNAVGKNEDDFISFDQPTFCRSVCIPSPMIEENSFALGGFGDFCHSIGDRVLTDADAKSHSSAEPLYVVKSPLKSGVSSITNEEEVQELVSRAGVDIFVPELYSLSEQVATWRGRDTIVGFLGSGLHTTLFAPDKNVIGLSYTDRVNSNQVLIDKLCRNKAAYLYPYGGVSTDHSQKDTRFHYTATINDPAAVAAGILREIDRCYSDGPLRRRDIIVKTAFTAAVTDEPLGANLSGYFGASQSLAGHLVQASNDIAASRALAIDPDVQNGVEAGSALGAWWSATTVSLAYLHEVRIFGSTTPSQGQAKLIVVDEDGKESEVLMFKMEGTRQSPIRWRPLSPTTVKAVVIRLVEEGSLLVERVEIFGEMIDPTKRRCGQ